MKFPCAVFFAAVMALVVHAAHAQDACPLPAGVAPLPDLPVTAQQVEDGSASLMEFALAARGEFNRPASSPEEGLHLGCLVRLEGTSYRSGSTYFVSLTPDGRVFVHAKDMSLAGRLLHPLIYGSVLQALGINPTELTNPAGAQSAFLAALAGNGGMFNVPNIPGASGYAAAYYSADFRSPIILLAGFDLNASHVAQEDIDYGDPAVTAGEVVDRETLKAFVTQAGEFFLERQQSGDPSAPSRSRIALRDPNGPWRHGSVYLYFLDLTSNIIVIHGAFPDRYELRPLIATVRDVVTGELILPQVIEAATSNPEGGFVQYYFDDPTDDADSADIPKVGYARQFQGDLDLGTHVVPFNFVVGSGFYLSDPGVGAARQNAVVETVLPQVMRAMTASTVDSIAGRIQRADSDSPPAAIFNFGGASTLSDAVTANGRALQDGTFDISRLLARSSFTLPLDVADNGGRAPFGSLTLWGNGDYRSFSGGDSQTLDYDGNVMSASLGIDTWLNAEVLAGMTLAQSQGTVDYDDSYSLTGEVTASLTSINPYVGWRLPGGMTLWATAGYGTGEVETDDESVEPETSDLTQQMVAAGVSGQLMTSDHLLSGGTTSLRIKGETAFTRAKVDGAETIKAGTFNVSRHRLMVEGSHVQAMTSGATFTPSVEVGVRSDRGDGETGTSIEAGGGLRYADHATGLTIEARARTLLAHSGDYKEWGISGLVRIDPGAAGMGLSLSVRPAWGHAVSGVQRLWESGIAGDVSADEAANGRMRAELGYGISAARGLGIVTPYAGIGLAEQSARSWRMGVRWQMAPDTNISLQGDRRETANGDGPEHIMMVRSAMRW